MNSERRMSFSRFRSNVVYFQQFLCLNFLFTNSSSDFNSILSTNSCLRISKIRFIIPMFLMFIYISRYKDLFFFGLQWLGRFPIIQSSSSCPFTFITLQFYRCYFSAQALCKLQLLYSHATSQRQIQCSIVLSHCGFMFLFKLFLFKLSRHILRDSGLKRFFNIYINTIEGSTSRHLLW